MLKLYNGPCRCSLFRDQTQQEDQRSNCRTCGERAVVCATVTAWQGIGERGSWEITGYMCREHLALIISNPEEVLAALGTAGA